jgi:hypothetical protein
MPCLCRRAWVADDAACLRNLIHARKALVGCAADDSRQRRARDHIGGHMQASKRAYKRCFRVVVVVNGVVRPPPPICASPFDGHVVPQPLPVNLPVNHLSKTEFV